MSLYIMFTSAKKKHQIGFVFQAAKIGYYILNENAFQGFFKEPSSQLPTTP